MQGAHVYMHAGTLSNVNVYMHMHARTFRVGASTEGWNFLGNPTSLSQEVEMVNSHIVGDSMNIKCYTRAQFKGLTMSTLSYRRASHHSNYTAVYFHAGAKKFGFVKRIITCCKESPSDAHFQLAIVEPLMTAPIQMSTDTITNAILPHIKAVLLDR